MENPNEPAEGARQQFTSRFEALLFSDVVDSTGLKHRIGTLGYSQSLQLHNALFEKCAADAEGRIIKHTGDGYFACFATPTQATNFALSFQRLLTETAWPAEAISARIGIHVGEVEIVRMAGRTDIVGSPADVAARVMSLGCGGQILVSRAAADEARRFTHANVLWTNHGHYSLKGVEQPVQIWEVAPVDRTRLPPPAGAVSYAGSTVPKPSHSERPEKIGPYRILAVLGEGGMGTVYKAEQREPIQRTVALKSIKPGFDTEDVIARFESERQALARMSHPNVAKVLDAGADAMGRPYFVMEFVPGVPITQFADDNTLSISARLLLFEQVCDAITHAHTKALIHRDIKAGNVLAYMADGKPTVKVIDFGIAKALTGDRLIQRTFNTGVGQVIGTYESMSPEQADGSADIDITTDVYSLGVLLYELLTGVKPFDDATLAKAADEEIRRIIREVDPPRPSTRLVHLGDTSTKVAAVRQQQVDTLAKQLRTELEWIPLKALRKERSRRYQSVAELSKDIDNYLSNRPLRAGPESVQYRLRKAIRRNRTALTSAAAVALLVLGGVAAYVHGISAEQRRTAAALREVRDEQVKTRSALETAEVQRERAEENNKLALQRYDEKRVALDDMLSIASDETLRRIPGSQFVREAFLERGIDQYQRLLKDRNNDATVRVNLADASRELGVLMDDVGDNQRGLQALTNAVATRREIATSAATPADQVALARALMDLANFYFEHGPRSTAAISAKEAIDCVAPLAKSSSDSPIIEETLGRAQTRLASVPEKVDGPLLVEAIRHLHAAADAEPMNDSYQVELARAALNQVADCSDDDLAKPTNLVSIATAEHALAEARRINPNNVNACMVGVTAVERRGTILRREQGYDAQIASYKAAIEQTARFTHDNPAATRGYLALVELYWDLAELYRTSDHHDEAVTALAAEVEALDTIIKSTSTDPVQRRDRVNALRVDFEIDDGRSRPAATTFADRIRFLEADDLAACPDDVELLQAHMDARGEFAQSAAKRDEFQSQAEDDEAAFKLFENSSLSKTPTNAELLLSAISYADSAADAWNHSKQFDRGVAVARSALKLEDAPKDTETNRNVFNQLRAALARGLDGDGKYASSIDCWDTALRAADIRVQTDPRDYWARRTQLECLQGSAQAHRHSSDAEGERLAVRKYLTQAKYFGDLPADVLALADTPLDNQTLARLRTSIDETPDYLAFNIKFTGESDSPIKLIVIHNGIQPLEDQFYQLAKLKLTNDDALVEFRNVKKTADENHFPFRELCEYAMSNRDRPDAKVTQQILADINAVRPLLAVPDRAAHARTQIARLYAYYARECEATNDLAGAVKQLDRALTSLHNSDGTPEPAFAADLRRQRAVLRARYDDPQAAYTNLCAVVDADQTLRGQRHGSEEKALGDLSIAKARPLEAACWYWRAVDAGRDDALPPLLNLYLNDRTVAPALPPGFEHLLHDAAASISKDQPQIFVSRVRELWLGDLKSRVAELSVDELIRRAKVLEHEQAIALLESAPNKQDPRINLAIVRVMTSGSTTFDKKLSVILEQAFASRPDDADGSRIVLEYLQDLLVHDEAARLLDVSAKLDASGWKPKGSPGEATALNRVYWTLRSFALIARGQDALAVTKIAQQEPSDDEPLITWDWQRILAWAPEAQPEERRGDLFKAVQAACAFARERLSHADVFTLNTQSAGMADLLVKVKVLCEGDLEGKPFWCVATVKPSRAAGYSKARQEGKFILEDFADIVFSGPGSEPPPDYKDKMEAWLGADLTYEEELVDDIQKSEAGLKESPSKALQDRANARGMLTEGHAAVVSGDCAKGISSIESGLKVFDHNSAAFQDLWLAHRKLGQTEAANEALSAWLTLASTRDTSVTGMIELAEALILSGRAGEAVKFIELHQNVDRVTMEAGNGLDQERLATFRSVHAIACLAAGIPADEVLANATAMAAALPHADMGYDWSDLRAFIKTLPPAQLAAGQHLLDKIAALPRSGPATQPHLRTVTLSQVLGT